MATTPVNNIKRSVAPKTVFASALDVISSAVSFNQGDMLYLDTATGLIKPIAADANSASFLGVAPVTIVSGKLKGPYSGLTAVDAAEAISDIPGPVFGVVAEFTLNTGDSVSPGAVMYSKASVSAQTVTSATASGSEVIGVYQGAAIAGAAAGTKVQVMLGARYPENVLKF